MTTDRTPPVTGPTPPDDDARRVRAALIAALPGAHPWGEVVDQLLPTVRALMDEHAAKVLEPFEELFAGGPDTSCRTVWDESQAVPALGIGPLECVSIPMDDLRDAFDRARALTSDHATQEATT